MHNMKNVAVLAAIVFFIGIVTLALAASPIVTLLGEFAIVVSLIAFAALATTYVMAQSFAAHALLNEDFHWH